jgi:hypothetical protein
VGVFHRVKNAGSARRVCMSFERSPLKAFVGQGCKYPKGRTPISVVCDDAKSPHKCCEGYGATVLNAHQKKLVDIIKANLKFTPL